eukprot:534421-Pyramimonas_sp.AAC.1
MRQSVGASRAAQAMEAFVVDVAHAKRLESVVKPDLLKNVKKEAEQLLPHLRTLNAAGLPTPGSQTKDGRTKLFKRSARMPQCRILSRSRLLRPLYTSGSRRSPPT